ncbi:hypothetical protein GW813_04715, partial [bacterium]|nr:hypothetical protein [bacterium]
MMRLLWLVRWLALAALLQLPPLPAEDAADATTHPVSWRERYTLGPGDVIDIRFYGRGELERTGVRIAPDGTLSYLQVNSLDVHDMTIDEL